MRPAILLIFLFGYVLAQEDGSLLNVRQIMKDTFDIIRNAPPLPGLNEVSKIILSTTQAPPVRQYVAPSQPAAPAAAPALTYEQIQMLRSQAAQQQPTNVQQLTQQQQIQRLQLLQRQYQQQLMQQQHQQQGGQVVYGPQADYGRAGRYGPVAQPQPALNPLARIFATPTEKDVERLLRLPTDILYKMAEEGHYIDNERDNNQYYDSRSNENNRPSSSGFESSSSSFGNGNTGAAPDAAGGLFGNGFSFNLQGNGDNVGTPVTPPMEIQNMMPQAPVEATTPSVSSVTPSGLTSAENASLSTLPEFKFDVNNVSKPYFVYRTYDDSKNDHWELVVPNVDGKPSIRMPMAEVIMLSKIVAKASHRAGMHVAAPQPINLDGLNSLKPEVLAALASTAAPATAPPTPPPSEPPVLPPKQNASPASAFVQESESPKIEKPDETTAGKGDFSNGQEIVLNGKRYKLIDDNGNVDPIVFAAAKAEEVSQQVASMMPKIPVQSQAQLPALITPQEQPIVPQLTVEQQNILNELQQRILRQQISRQQLEIQQMLASQQPQAQAAPTFVMTESEVVVPPKPDQAYYAKVQMPVESSQTIVQETSHLEPYQLSPQTIITQQQQHAMAVVKTPVQVVKPQLKTVETVSPVLNRYSMDDLEAYYKAHNTDLQHGSSSTVETTTKTTPEHVFAPHKQVKIHVNNTVEKNPVEFGETVIVDATANAADQEKQRVADLRRQFAVERQHLNRLSKSKIERTAKLDATTTPAPLVTEQHCYNIRSFAKQHGFSNTQNYANMHCHFIENYYPDLKCANVKDYMQICEQYYSTRRLLFTA